MKPLFCMYLKILPHPNECTYHQVCNMHNTYKYMTGQVDMLHGNSVISDFRKCYFIVYLAYND